ncbi:unnamed protein product [Peronospora farinosa]|uniref:ABCA1-4-like C-terminal R2 regulatory domain-containing protein n=1 Tax=Peronospora farinosa TaxID=134698 RepID=A0ABN8C700_9STRA|nr:unnamed protein product [Peronospora farinosa]
MSTTTKVLTGKIALTNGFVTFKGYDLARDCAEALEKHLELYAHLKGISSDRVKSADNQKIEKLELNQATQGLSEGNKRKNINSYRIDWLFLDFLPGRACDGSRHKLAKEYIEVQRILRCNTPWSFTRPYQHSVSSLEVSNRVKEIVEGKRNGNVLQSHLETSGTIPINVFCAWWYTKDVGGALQLKFDCKFPGCQLVGHQGDHFRFQVPKQSLRPYAIFGFLDENKERLHIDVYGVSETSLEHIFNTMAVYKGDEQLQGSARYCSA